MVDLEFRANDQDFALLDSGDHRYLKLKVSRRPFRGAWLTTAVISGRRHPVHAIKINSCRDLNSCLN